MASKSIDLKLVGVALIPAVAVGAAVAIVGRLANVADATVDAVTLVLFFPIFLGAYHARQRRSGTQG